MYNEINYLKIIIALCLLVWYGLPYPQKTWKKSSEEKGMQLLLKCEPIYTLWVPNTGIG